MFKTIVTKKKKENERRKTKSDGRSILKMEQRDEEKMGMQGEIGSDGGYRFYKKENKEEEEGD